MMWPVIVASVCSRYSNSFEIITYQNNLSIDKKKQKLRDLTYVLTNENHVKQKSFAHLTGALTLNLKIICLFNWCVDAQFVESGHLQTLHSSQTPWCDL